MKEKVQQLKNTRFQVTRSHTPSDMTPLEDRGPPLLVLPFLLADGSSSVSDEESSEEIV